MLEFLKVKNPDQIKSVLKNYDPLKDTWIVSDLKSKQEIQALALNRYSYYTDDAILRISDFWRLWIRRLEPTLQVVSSDFIKSLVQNFVDRYGAQLDLLDSEVLTLFKAVQEFAPLILHPTSHEVIQEWLAQEFEKNNTEKKWQRWYQLAKVCINYIVNENNAIDSKWSAAYLQSSATDLISWPRRIFVDLGSELTSVEMGLIKIISQKQDVFVVVPDPEWKDQFENILKIYPDSFGYGKITELAQDSAERSKLEPRQFVRLSTQLSEVKFATAKIREWLGHGVNLQDISIVSADIERYWPVLQIYLDTEGIPYNKDIVSQFNSLGDIQSLLAALKNYSHEVAWDSLEKSVYSRQSNPAMSFEKFKALFYQLYDEDDLGRDAKIKELFFKKINLAEEVERDDFLSFVVKTWLSLPQSKTKSELFESLFKDILSHSLNIKMKLSLWVSFLKNRLSSKELIIHRNQAEGIHILSLMSAHMIECTHRIYLGMNEELFNKKQLSLMSASDSLSIKTQFDLSLDCSEESYLDFNLRWQAQATDSNTYFTSAHLSFESDPLNASLFFLENCPQSETMIPADTRADELQKSYTHIDETGSEVSHERLKWDLNNHTSVLSVDVFRELSVSDFENYAKCSFKLLAAKGFKLRDYSQTGIDLDPRDKGNLAHALFEFIIKKLSTGAQLATTDIESFLNEERLKRGLFKNQEDFWGVQKKRFIKIAQQFYDFEKERLKIYSSEVEKDYKFYFDLNELSFTAAKPEVYFQFNLRIDRIDTHKSKNYRIIYDYKSSDGSIKTAKNWLTHYQFQMLLYLVALELTEADPETVKGALYYFYKNFNITKGIIDRDTGLNDFSISARNASSFDSDSFAQIHTDFKLLVGEILNKLNRGEFSTAPYDADICKDCDWSKLCRAPHLL